MTTPTTPLSRLARHCLALPLLALGLACGAGDGKTTDASAGTGSSSTGSTGGATTVVSTGPTSTSGDTAGNTGTGTTDATTGPGTTGQGTTSTGTTDASTGPGTTGQGTTSTTTTDSSSSGGEPCQGQGQSCADVGALCCAGLTCCAGVPVPEGQEFCSDNCPISDRNLKTDLAAIDPAQVLARVVALPISTWRYRKDGAEVRHLGPMAQDFHAAFGLWNTDTMIFPLDASGVSFAAIQALNSRLVAAEAENEALRARLERLERAVELR